MARNDIDGFFWNDTPPPKPPPKAKPKRNPPPRTWESPDYLPNLAEALAFDVPQFTDAELMALPYTRERIIFDIECYPNYFLIVFQGVSSGKIVYFEMTPDHPLNISKLGWVAASFCLIGFNSYNYDIPILTLALAGKTNSQLQWATDEIIRRNERPQDVLRKFKVKKLNLDHIDLIEVAPLRASLKIYAGRLHAKRMQDLPFIPGTVLSPNQQAIVKWYCVNDTRNTTLLYEELEEPIKLREVMGIEYGIDLRSRSDAQIAESVIAHEVAKLNGARSKRPEFIAGTGFNYQVPHFIKYTSPEMLWTLETVRNARFIISETGEVGMPVELSGLTIPIAGRQYRMGIGGLHSSEQVMAHFADADTLLVDRDATSFYPKIILNQGLFPQHLGVNFLRVYQRLVDRRLYAKDTGDKKTADSLKITINGSSGKLGSPYSMLYSPHLLVQVTLTGQLVLLMLIERLEAIGLPVVSANTDGLIIKCPVARKTDLDAVILQWEEDTDFPTEETQYKAVFSRDVNNYIAIKTEPGKAKAKYLDERLGCKTKGAYCERGSSGNSRLSKNPAALICSDAVLTFLTTGDPISKTIRECLDVTRFVSVRTVKGGAVKDGIYLGKSIRWYYAVGEQGEIIYALNGNKVPRSDNAKPLMDLPDIFPTDVDYQWYEDEAFKILQEIGYEKAL